MDNYTLGDSLSSRTTSGFPLSIGTSIAFESIFNPRQDPYDKDRKIPNMVSIFNYQAMYINVATLFRNIAGAVKKEIFINAKEDELKFILLDEIDTINSLLANEGNGICVPIFYTNNYNALRGYTLRHNILLRDDKSEYQKLYTHKYEQTLKSILKETDDIVEFNSEIKSKHKIPSLILSHVPYDLISYSNFSKLDLLESHTGKLKEKYSWNTKYYPIGDNDLTHLPFNKKLLMVLGDKVLIHPSDYKLRKLIHDISINRNWTPMTTLDKIMLDFSLDIKEPFVLNYLRHL